MKNYNVIKYLKLSADQKGDKTALIMEDRGKKTSVSFKELWNRTDTFSAALVDFGLKPGERVIVMIPMSVELYIVLLGIIKAGCVAVFADPWVSTAQIASFCDFAKPGGFVGIGKSHLIRLMKRSLFLIPVSITSGVSFLGIPAKNSLKNILKYGKGDGGVFEASANDPALITFTSGSSGIPKGANRTHGFLTAQYEALKSEFEYSDTDVDMPMFPVFALNNLARGITSVIPDMDFKNVAGIDSAKIYHQMKTYGITTCTASPPFFDRLADSIQKEGKTFELRRILTGGAPVSDEQLRIWKNAFPGTHVEIVYGSTEAEPVSHISLDDRLGISGSMEKETVGYCMGIPAKVVEARIIAITHKTVSCENGWPDCVLKNGEIGELIVTGDHVCKDYFNNPKAVAENKIIDEDGRIWHRMGDTGFMDEKGRFWLVGRVHSTIVRNGEMVHAQVVEQTISNMLKSPERIAAVGLPDVKLGEKLVLVIEHNGKVSEALAAKIKKSAAACGIPVDEIKSVRTKFPVDPRHNSKIDYTRLRNRIMKRTV